MNLIRTIIQIPFDEFYKLTKENKEINSLLIKEKREEIKKLESNYKNLTIEQIVEIESVNESTDEELLLRILKILYINRKEQM